MTGLLDDSIGRRFRIKLLHPRRTTNVIPCPRRATARCLMDFLASGLFVSSDT